MKAKSSAIGVRVLEADAKRGDQRDQSASEQDRNSHLLILCRFSRRGMDAGDSRLFHMTSREVTFPISDRGRTQTTYWRKQVGELASQAGEMRALTTKVSADEQRPKTRKGRL